MTSFLHRCLSPILLLLILHIATMAHASMQDSIDQLQANAADIERDIGLLEQQLLFPPLTRVQVFLQFSPELNFSLNSVILLIDGEEKSFHIYDQKELTALQMGGIQSFWEGNVGIGPHTMLARFKGKSRDGDIVEKSVSYQFNKDDSGSTFAIQILPEQDNETPKIALKAWERR
ncbi:MAG: hypothetical protein HRU21_02370 [Pseudomonadales bacterium]|nr:hypothetical protein [Pseudomonadales bacterium]